MSDENRRGGKGEAPGKPRRVLRWLLRTVLAILWVGAVLVAGL